MSDFLVNFNFLGGLSVDEWWEEMDRMQEENQKKERRHTEINETLKSCKSQKNEAGTVKQTLWAVHCFQIWGAEKFLATDFKSIIKMELDQSLRQFCAIVEKHAR